MKQKSKMPKVSYVTLIAYMLFAGQCIACSFDTDCDVGSKCLKSSGNIYGVCIGGLNPGNANDNEPVVAPLDVNHTYGNTCSFDTDCGVGSRCMKGDGITGTCM